MAIVFTKFSLEDCFSWNWQVFLIFFSISGARSYGSSYFDDETAATPRLLESDDDTSLSSNDEDFSSSHSQVIVTVYQI